MCSVKSSLKLRQVVMKFAFLFQCLISLIWLKIHFLKPFFVLKKSLTFHGIFLANVLLAAVFKDLVICEYCSMLKAKKELNPNLGRLFRGLFFKVCVGGGKIIPPLPPCLTLDRIMLKTWNMVLKYKHICSFRKYTF